MVSSPMRIPMMAYLLLLQLNHVERVCLLVQVSPVQGVPEDGLQDELQDEPQDEPGPLPLLWVVNSQTSRGWM